MATVPMRPRTPGSAVTRAQETFPVAPGQVYRFTVDQYDQMAKLGILKASDRVELIEGWVVRKMTINPAHAFALTALQRRLTRLLPEQIVLRIQLPVNVGTSEPEPDIAICEGPENRYEEAHPRPRDVLLVVEVADASLPQDRGVKLQLYARARIPVYWIINLVDRRLEVYTQPRAGQNPTYRQQQILGPDDAVPVVVAGEIIGTVAVRELLPS